MNPETDIQWSEHPDQRFPGRTVLVGTVGTKTYVASYRERKSVATQAIIAAVRVAEAIRALENAKAAQS